MKKTGISCIMAVIVLISSGTPISAFADDRAKTIDILTSRDWRFTGIGWTNNRTFYRDGTMLLHSRFERGNATWKLEGNKVMGD